jgi:flavin-binding protein dodecin
VCRRQGPVEVVDVGEAEVCTVSTRACWDVDTRTADGTPGHNERDFLIQDRLSAKGHVMSQHTYRVTEIVGSSPDGVDQAIRNGVKRASQTLHNLDWFEVTEIRGHLANGDVEHVQVTMKVGFRLDEI